MTFPAQRTMLSLTCLSHCAAGYSTSDGRLVAVMRVDGGGKGRAWEVLAAELDELERIGWVALDPPAEGDAPNTARVRVTDSGRYWLRRWANKHRRELERGAAAGV